MWLQGVIWSLRVIYVGGAFVGWRAGRPPWFYPWLGFASYAAVAALLQFALRIDPRKRQDLSLPGLPPYSLGILTLLCDPRSWLAGPSPVDCWGHTRSFPIPHCSYHYSNLWRGRLWQRLAICNPFRSRCRRFRNAVLASSYSVPGWNQKLAASATSLPGCSCHECTVCARLRLRVWSWERLGHLDNVGPNSRH